MKHLAPGACGAVPEDQHRRQQEDVGFLKPGSCDLGKSGGPRRTHKAVKRSAVRENLLGNIFGFAVDWIFCGMEVIALSVVGLASLLCEGFFVNV